MADHGIASDRRRTIENRPTKRTTVPDVPVYALGDQVPVIAGDAFIHPDAVIIGSVVMINSVAWGIPLLIGNEHAVNPRDNLPAAIGRGGLSGSAAQRHVIPLPQRAPRRAHVPSESPSRTPGDVGTPVVASAAPTPDLANRQPATLFPRPVSRHPVSPPAALSGGRSPGS